MTPEEMKAIQDQLEALKKGREDKVRRFAEAYGIQDPAQWTHVGDIIPMEHVHHHLRTLKGRLQLHRLASGQTTLQGQTLTCPDCIAEIHEVLTEPVPGVEFN